MTDSGSGPEVYGGRYEIERRLARGGMADVYLARDTLLDRPVALKVLFPEFATDHSFVERFRREAQAAANLNHPNIVAVYDWGEEGSTYFIVMEYIDGRSLSQIVRDEGPLEPTRAAEITQSIAGALGFAHRNGVIHRDVKPGNVLLAPQGQVKVTDFGIARAVSASENLTQTGTVMGTATYFSPEQARGEPVDPRSDVYSLGIVLYELLVGAPPFTGDSPVSVAYKHVSEQAELPRRRNPRIPAPLEAVTMRALAKNPANRYDSADDFAADLRRFIEGAPVQAESVLAAEDFTQAVGTTAAGEATRAIPLADSTRVMTSVGGGTAPPPARRSPLFYVVVGLIALLIAGGAAAIAASLSGDGGGGGGTVTVPSVLGLTKNDARIKLKDAGLHADFQDESSDTVPEGAVISQDPAPNTSAGKGSSVTVKVSTGKGPVTVPDLVGRTEADALAALRAAGLEAGISRVNDDAHDPGTVLDQSPQPGEQAQRGSAVRITVSQGPGQVQIPDVTGLSPTDAANQLGRAGFVADSSTTDEPSNTVEEGKVTRTDPPAGTAADKGSNVHIYTSSGPAPEVPNVIGENHIQAGAELRAAGYSVQRTFQEVSDPGQDGVVLNQSPAGGTQAAEGSTVTITVGSFRTNGSSSTTTTAATG
ncbi:MAG: Stk1 family PASTA domain-containing Ser/Thr kinase [Acidobacteria bacterium]|nr:Stk1 family PASTA domain-containing Ser/Thr kinase [Acidobacteriota bacterium]